MYNSLAKAPTLLDLDRQKHHKTDSNNVIYLGEARLEMHSILERYIFGISNRTYIFIH
jgi:hypothetical protein